MIMIEIKNLHASIESKPVLKGLSLKIGPGEVHAIMGPNGSGKSTLSKVIAGHPSYDVTEGQIMFDVNFESKNILDLSADERAREGIFLAMQYPVEIPGITNFNFLMTAFNNICKHHGSEEMNETDFRAFLDQKLKLVNMGSQFLDRSVNFGFSGGEKKRNEILQMAVLSPRFSVLDEIDSGLDIDALKDVAAGVNKIRSKNNSILMITHYQRLLDYIKPDFVHVMINGKIVKSGDASLALEMEKQGYDWLM